MNFIFVLPRSSPRPSWSVTRTFCSLSEGWGGAVDDAGCGNFKPIKKKKKRVQPREVDVCLCAQDMEGNVKYLIALFSLPSSTPPIVQTVTWSLPSPPSCGSSRCGMPGIARDRAVANLLMTSLPKSVARSKNASARVSERKSLCVTCYVTVHFLLQSAKRRELPQTIFSLLARNFFDTFVVDSLRWRDQLGTR